MYLGANSDEQVSEYASQHLAKIKQDYRQHILLLVNYIYFAIKQLNMYINLERLVFLLSFIYIQDATMNLIIQYW
jgi:hypothetical protein